MRTPLIAGNWKMNTSIREALNLVKGMMADLDKIRDIEKVICPPFVSLYSIKEMIKNSSIKLGGQNMYFEESGPFTGEVSAIMLHGLCEYVIIGHSERRQLFFETDSLINNKLCKAVNTGLIPILCVGENQEENEAEKTREVIERQVHSGLFDIQRDAKIVIAYEPIWAIGTGKSASGNQANEVATYIRQIISEMWGKTASQKIQILYGGSVTGENISQFVSKVEIDGALVGGASLKAQEFVSIVNQTSNIKSSK